MIKSWKFSIRGLGFIIVCVAFFLVLVRWHREDSNRRLAALRRMESSGATIVMRTKSIRAPLWLQYIFGADEWKDAQVVRFVSGDPVLDCDVLPLACLLNLEELWIVNASLTPKGISVIRELPMISVLVLEGAGINDEALIHLQGIKSLKRLHLAKTAVTGATIDSLASSGINSLSLSETSIDSGGVRKLAKLSHLTCLSLAFTAIDDEDIKKIAGSMRSLEELDLRSTRITDDALGQIGRLVHLREVYLDDTRVTGREIKRLGALPSLEYISVSQLDGATVECFVKEHPSVRVRHSQ